MARELSLEQQKIIDETAAVENPEAFQALLAASKDERAKVFQEIEVQEPARPVAETLTELRGLYLLVVEQSLSLAAADPTAPQERALLRDAIQLATTAQGWFGEGLRSGVFRARTAREVVDASRPWRLKLKLMGRRAFSYSPATIESFADVNSTQTVDEERRDLQTLLSLVEEHKTALEKVGLTPAFVAQGQTLLRAVDIRDLSGILGLQDQAEASALRDQLLTYAVVLARKAGSLGSLAFFEDELLRKRFDDFTFGGSLRKSAPAAAAKPKAPEAPAETTPPKP